ncbi:n-acetylgalactosamine-4-sulfatase [Flavivirga aquatica]|uniref:N-acetylgalactosamine-4-sulfatase n=1 Tax=Flavivirga aquatica TaxID=1849968 RepID=A0A1E5SIS4_9FLAO|nr:arylsulfatase [Flavivirga aquatica]OEJ99018.1 n-acetylgalactosamine-4-sulfatase [Flavivirga aquatica]
MKKQTYLYSTSNRKTRVLLFLMVFIYNFQSLIAQDRPNIIIMMSDDQGYGDIGSHGNPYLKTPHMESIGEQGIEMTHFFTYPNCSASRAALLTGRYPYRAGVTAVTQVDHFMNASETTIAEVLADNGYRTGIFGKWHLGDNIPMRPTDQGFQEALIHKGGGIGQAAGPAGNTYFDPVLEHNNVSKKYDGYCDDIFTDAALDFMSKKDGKPFFTYLATNLPHFPLQVPDKRAEPFRKMGLHEDNALTYGMIDNIDYNVGRVLDKLKDLGIADNTIVIFLSDNGPRHRRTKNDSYPGRWVANLRGTKTSVYDAGIRVPFFVKWPDKIKPQKQATDMGAIIDLFPTLLDAAKVKSPKGVHIDGQSLLPLWTKNKADNLKERDFFVQMHYGPTPFKYMHFTVRTPKYKLVSPHDFPHGIVHQPTDHVLKHVLKNLELYDVEKDPSERINIAKDHPEIVDEMLARYESWFDEVNEERDEKGIQRIHLGSDKQLKLTLSKFDWGGPRVISRFDYGGPRVIEDNQLGYWRVETEKGIYNVSYDLPEIKADGVAHLKYKNKHVSVPIKKGQKKVVFNNFEIPSGTGNFHAFIKIERLAFGPLFVDVERLIK